MTKIISLILSALILSSTFISCSETTDNADTAPSPESTPPAAESESESEPEETLISDNLGEHNFNGYNFRIAASTMDFSNTIIEDEFTGTPVVDTIRKGTIHMEERFNITFSSVEYGLETRPFQIAINAGDDAYDLQISPDWTMYPMAQEGMFYDLFEIAAFDFSKPWWPANITEILTINDSMYTGANYLSYQGLHWERALIINKDLAEILNLELPYDMIREGKWTLDAMLSYVEGVSRDIDGDGIISGDGTKDYIGYVTGKETMYCIQESMGISPYVKNDDGKIDLVLDLEKIDSFINKMRDFMDTDDYYENSTFGQSFMNGTTLLCYGQLADAYDIYSKEDFTYGFLSFPKYDEYQEDYINCCTDTPWAFPITLSEDQLAMDGIIAEALSCYNYQHVLPAYFDVALKSRLADSPDDAEQLQLIADTRTTSFAFAYGLLFKNLLGDLKDSKAGPSSYIAKQEKSARKYLDRVLSEFDEVKARQG